DGDEEVCPAACDWVRATDADVRRDDMVRIYRALLALPLGATVEDRFNGRLWRLSVVSRDTDPTTGFAKDVRGWICRSVPETTMGIASPGGVAAGGRRPLCRGLGRLPQMRDFVVVTGRPHFSAWSTPPFAMEEWNLA